MKSLIRANQTVLLTVEDILRLKQEYEADVRLLDELPGRIQRRKSLYEAALMFAPEGFSAESDHQPPLTSARPAVQAIDPRAAWPLPRQQPSTPPRAEQPSFLLDDEDEGVDQANLSTSWAGAMRAHLEEAGRGVSRQELLDALLSQGLQDSRGHKGFYNAISRLQQRQQLIKVGGLLYAPKVLADMQARGESAPEVQPNLRQGGAGQMVLDVLHEHPSGLDVAALRARVVVRPGAPASLANHSHYIFNVLSTLMGQGLVEKDDQGIYRAKEKG